MGLCLTKNNLKNYTKSMVQLLLKSTNSSSANSFMNNFTCSAFINKNRTNDYDITQVFNYWNTFYGNWFKCEMSN